MKIADAGNTTVPAYLALLAKGYSVDRRPASNETGEVWTATSADHGFSADDIVSVLGLVAMFETRGAEWKASDREIEVFLERFPHD